MLKFKLNHLITTIIFALVVVVSLYFQYDLFVFHTFDQSMYYSYSTFDDSKLIDVNDLHIVHNHQSIELFSSNMVIHEANIQELEFVFELDNKKVEESIKIDQINQHKIIKVKSFHQIDHLTINLKNNEIIESVEIKLTPNQLLDGTTRDYRFSNIYLSQDFLQLGKLYFDEEIKSKYDEIALEYRYLKDDEYIVFNKISMPINEYINSQMSYHLIEENPEISKQPLSVVVILSGKNIDEYVFAIDLVAQGDSYE